MDDEAEGRALRESLSALAARTQAIRLELEAYQRDIMRSGGGEGTTLLSAAFAEVLGGGSRTGSLRRLEAAASTLLRIVPVSVPEDQGGGGAGEPGDGGSRRQERPRGVAISGGGSAGRRPTIRVRYGDRSYDRDLALCRRALLDLEIKDGVNGVHQFAASIGVSTTTISGFLGGTVPCSEELTRRIVAGLRLTWEQVHREVPATPVNERGEGQ